MQYHTQKKKLILPDYGRNVQNMVDHCKALEDKDERTKCAYTIVEIMGNMFPHLRDIADFQHILWDHIAIMADFELDIEYPFKVITQEELYTRPNQLPYSRPTMSYRHYGKLLEKMIKIAGDMEEGKEKEQLIALITTQMMQAYQEWNKEADDRKILDDLYELSDGKIKLPDNYKITLPKAAGNTHTQRPQQRRRGRSNRNQRRR